MSKSHTTNYYNTFIALAEDSPISAAEMPPEKEGKKTVARYQFNMLYDHPYQYTSDDVFFTVHALRKEIPENEWKEQRQEFFSRGQPCFRSSPLTKRYGWGIHSNAQGRVAMYAMESSEYKAFLNDDSVKKVKAMGTKRKS